MDDWLARIHPDGTIEKVKQLGHAGKMLSIGDDMYLYAGGRTCWGDLASLRRIRGVFQRQCPAQGKRTHLWAPRSRVGVGVLRATGRAPRRNRSLAQHTNAGRPTGCV